MGYLKKILPFSVICAMINAESIKVSPPDLGRWKKETY